MKKIILKTIRCASPLVCALCVTITGNAQNPVAFDVEKAIQNPRPTDLVDFATTIEYVPLDDSRKDGLLSGIMAIAESKTGFYIADDEERAVKLFDRGGRFVATRGSIGRGPGEFTLLVNLAVDYDSDDLYVISSTGAQTPVVAYDADGKFVARTSVPLNIRNVAIHDGQVMALQRSPHHPLAPSEQSTIGTWVPLIEIFSPTLEHRQTIEIVDKGSGQIVVMDGDLAAGTLVMNLGNQSRGVLSSDGQTLTVKDERGDVAYHYRDGQLVPAYRLDNGRYTVPDNLYARVTSNDLRDHYQTQRLIESERYVFLSSRRTRNSEIVQIVLDKTAPDGGLTATGPRGENGLLAGGIAFTPMYVRDGRLVGWMSALDITDNTAAITDPKLRTLAATLKEDSNPVLVVATLKK